MCPFQDAALLKLKLRCCWNHADNLSKLCTLLAILGINPKESRAFCWKLCFCMQLWLKVVSDTEGQSEGLTNGKFMSFIIHVSLRKEKGNTISLGLGAAQGGKREIIMNISSHFYALISHNII